jgi:hypothetical protein
MILIARPSAPHGADAIYEIKQMMIPAMFRRQPPHIGADIGRGNRQQQQPAALG